MAAALYIMSNSKKIKLSDNAEDGGLNRKIAKQLEYYFSDVNVVQDKFLLEEFRKNEGWVNLSTLLTFSRLKALTTDKAKLVEALKEHGSGIVELDDAGILIRRKEPLPDKEEFQKDLDSRTLHISGFPTDYTFDFLHNWCSQHGQVDSLSMRNHFKTRQFKGNIIVSYKSKSDADKIMDADSLKCKDRELRKENMEQYRNRKIDMAKKRFEKRVEKKGKKRGGKAL